MSVENHIQFIQGGYSLLPESAKSLALTRCIRSDHFQSAVYPHRPVKSLPRDVQQEPASALDGGEDGLNFYRIIIKYTPRLLRTGACLMMEFGDGQAEAIKKLFEAQKSFFRYRDYSGFSGAGQDY